MPTAFVVNQLLQYSSSNDTTSPHIFNIYMTETQNQTALFTLTDVSKQFSKTAKPVVSNVSFSVFEHDCIVVSGQNGSGKTVLMTLIAGLEQPTSGSIYRKQHNGKDIPVGLVFQDADTQILGDTVEEDILFGVRNSRLSQTERADRLETVLQQLGLSEKRKFPARSLSGGEKRRLAVAGILMMEADIIIFDEPFANLDFPGVVQVTSMIRQLKGSGKSILVLTHELEKVLGLANRLLILHKGTLVYDADPESALHNGILAQYGIRNPLCTYRSIKDLVWNADEPH